MTDAVAEHNQGVYDQIASGYDQRQASRERQAGRNRWPADLAGALLARLPLAAQVADLGCGPARDGRWLAEAGHRVVGLDRSAGLLTIARQSLPRRVVQADLRYLPLADGVLLDGGVLALTTAAGDGTRLEPVPFAPDHKRWFFYWQPDQLRDRMVAAGFRVLAMTQQSTHRDWVKILAVASH